jgi:hypothetical protein
MGIGADKPIVAIRNRGITHSKWEVNLGHPNQAHQLVIELMKVSSGAALVDGATTCPSKWAIIESPFIGPGACPGFPRHLRRISYVKGSFDCVWSLGMVLLILHLIVFRSGGLLSIWTQCLSLMDFAG